MWGIILGGHNPLLCIAGQHNPVDAAAGGVDATDGAGQQEHRQHGAREQVRRGHQAPQARHRLRSQFVPVIFSSFLRREDVMSEIIKFPK